MSDDPNVTGKADRDYVARGQPHEVDTFVGSYMKSRSLPDNADVRMMVRTFVLTYKAGEKVRRDDMEAFIDSKIFDKK